MGNSISENYKELLGSLIKCYKDVYILDAILQYNETVSDGKRGLPKASLEILSHFCFLVKADLCLSVWKIYFDKDGSANTVPHLVNEILQNIEFQERKKYKLKEKAYFKKVGNKLSEMRDRYLAHLDVNHNVEAINIDDMRTTLDFITEKFNLALSGLGDESMPQIDKEYLYKIQKTVSIGMGWFISNAFLNIEELSQ